MLGQRRRRWPDIHPALAGGFLRAEGDFCVFRVMAISQGELCSAPTQNHVLFTGKDTRNGGQRRILHETECRENHTIHYFTIFL